MFIIVTVIGIIFYIVPVVIAITLYKVVRAKNQPRPKMLLCASYALMAALLLNDSKGMDIADQHGLNGAEPLIFGTWQFPIQLLLILLILGLHFLIILRASRKNSSRTDTRKA